MIRTMMLGAALAATTMFVAPATAKTYDLATDFSTPNFKYGTVSPAGAFSSFATSDCSAIGIPATCYRGSDTFQVIALHSATELLVHPGPNAGQNTAVAFVAPHSGTYTFSADFTRGDTGDGVGVYGYLSSLPLIPFTTLNAANPTYGFSGLSVFLAKGQAAGFALDRGPTTYYNDSTFVSGSVIASVPEPATWALMILGFGAVGYAMRRRAAVRTSVRFA